jgi:hypothetical protein
MKRLALFGCAGLALAALATGCGGGGGSSASDGEFAAEAEAVCARANQQVGALEVPEAEAELLSYVEKYGSIVEGLGRQIAELGGSGAAAGAYEAGLEESTKVLNEMSNAARSENPGALGELANQLAEIRLARLAEAAGLEGCAKAPPEAPPEPPALQP